MNFCLLVNYKTPSLERRESKGVGRGLSGLLFSPVQAAAWISPSAPVFVRNKDGRAQGRINLGVGAS